MCSTKSLKELPVPANSELSASPKKSLAIQADRLTNILGDPLLDVKADLLNALKHRDIGVILALQSLYPQRPPSMPSPKKKQRKQPADERAPPPTKAVAPPKAASPKVAPAKPSPRKGTFPAPAPTSATFVPAATKNKPAAAPAAAFASQARPRRENAMSGVKTFVAGAAPPPRVAHQMAASKRKREDDD